MLRHSQLSGRKFRRQHSIGPYVIDFYCPLERLAIELDGAAHDSEPSATLDDAREFYLNAAGVTVLRVENRHVFENPDAVLELIRQQFKSG